MADRSHPTSRCALRLKSYKSRAWLIGDRVNRKIESNRPDLGP
jgi:hypothetical protein